MSTRQAVTTKVSQRVTACGREVIMPILGLVWQEFMCAVAAMSRKTTVKSDFIKYISTPFSEELNISMLFLSFLYNFFVPPLQFLRFLWFVDLSFALKCTMRKRAERQRAPLTRHCEGPFLISHVLLIFLLLSSVQ